MEASPEHLLGLGQKQRWRIVLYFISSLPTPASVPHCKHQSASARSLSTHLPSLNTAAPWPSLSPRSTQTDGMVYPQAGPTWGGGPHRLWNWSQVPKALSGWGDGDSGGGTGMRVPGGCVSLDPQTPHLWGGGPETDPLRQGVHSRALTVQL